MHEITSMMEETSENITDLSADDIGTIEEIPENSILSRQGFVNLVPLISLAKGLFLKKLLMSSTVAMQSSVDSQFGGIVLVVKMV